MSINLTDLQRRMMQRNHRQFRKWIYSAYFNNVEWLSDSAMEAWETAPYRYKHKLSRRRGTPWYRHRDAWARRYRANIADLPPRRVDYRFFRRYFIRKAPASRETIQCAT